MSGLADVLQPLSDERPGAALLRLLLAPTICVLSLVACVAGTRGGVPCRGGGWAFSVAGPEPRLEAHEPRHLGGLDDVAAFVKRRHVSAVYITLPVTSDVRIARLVNELRDTTASVYFVPDT